MKGERLVLKTFRADYRKMLLRVRTGEGTVEFPEGTYRLRLLGLRCKGCSVSATTKRASTGERARAAKRSKRAA